MFKSIVILAIISVVWSRPSYLHTAVVPYELEPTVVGHTVHSIPTAVSHQSQTIVHEKRPYLRPIIEHVPVVKSYAVPEVLSTSYLHGWDGSYGGSLHGGLLHSGSLYGGSVYGGWNQW